MLYGILHKWRKNLAEDRHLSDAYVHDTNVKAICIYSLKSMGFLRVFGTNVFSDYTKIKYEFSLHTVYTSVRSETNEYV